MLQAPSANTKHSTETKESTGPRGPLFQLRCYGLFGLSNANHPSESGTTDADSVASTSLTSFCEPNGSIIDMSGIENPGLVASMNKTDAIKKRILALERENSALRDGSTRRIREPESKRRNQEGKHEATAFLSTDSEIHACEGNKLSGEEHKVSASLHSVKSDGGETHAGSVDNMSRSTVSVCSSVTSASYQQERRRWFSRPVERRGVGGDDEGFARLCKILGSSTSNQNQGFRISDGLSASSMHSNSAASSFREEDEEMKGFDESGSCTTDLRLTARKREKKRRSKEKKGRSKREENSEREREAHEKGSRHEDILRSVDGKNCLHHQHADVLEPDLQVLMEQDREARRPLAMDREHAPVTELRNGEVDDHVEVDGHGEVEGPGLSDDHGLGDGHGERDGPGEDESQYEEHEVPVFSKRELVAQKGSDRGISQDNERCEEVVDASNGIADPSEVCAGSGPLDQKQKYSATGTAMEAAEEDAEEDADDTALTPEALKKGKKCDYIVSERRDVRNGYCDGLAFVHFVLLSLTDADMKTLLTDGQGSLLQDGARYLDPFLYDGATATDVYPKTSAENGLCDELNLSIDSETLSPVCFPRGAQVRLVPKAVVDQVERMRWVGDRYQTLVFRDPSGMITHGVAITTREIFDSEFVVSILSAHREQRRAAVIIGRWWRTRRDECQEGLENEAGFCDTRIELPRQFRIPAKTNGASSDDDSISLRSIFSRIRRNRGGSGGGRSVCGSVKSTNSKFERKKRPKAERSTKRNNPVETMSVNEIINEFLRTSSLPPFDSKSKMGVWRSAKLKISRRKKRCNVVVRHVDCEDLATRSSEQLQAERTRLTDMLAGATINCGSSSSPKRLAVRYVVFEEYDDIGNKKSKVTTKVPSRRVENEDVVDKFSTTVRRCAREAYKQMQAFDELGDVCIMEKSYVLLGVKPKELSLLFVALQHLVDTEKEAKTQPWSKQRLALMGVRKSLPAGEVYAPLVLKTSNEQTRHKYEQELRHSMLRKMRAKATLSTRENRVPFPKSELEYLYGEKQFFELSLSCGDNLRIRVPLPPPQIYCEWGFANLLLGIGGGALIKLLKHLVLERSVLLLGTTIEEVSACAGALTELLQPFEWTNTVRPVVPASMLDFVHSPVPFIMGMVGKDDDIEKIESDSRVKEALVDGMGVVNLEGGTTFLSVDEENIEVFCAPPPLSNALDELQDRLRRVVGSDSDSCVKSLQTFVRKGFSRRESVTLFLARQHITRYMAGLAGDLATTKGAWEQCGVISEATDAFHFYPDLFLDPKRAELDFIEEMVHTQLFVGFVESRKKYYEEQQRQRAGKRIADWIHEIWLQKEMGRVIAITEKHRAQKRDHKKRGGRRRKEGMNLEGNESKFG